MMLTQAHLVPLTEENLKKHQREATTERIPLKQSTTNISKSGKSLRSAGDGESIEFVSDEALKASLDEQRGDEKQIFDQAVVLQSYPKTCVVSEDMSKRTEVYPPADGSPHAKVDTSSKASNDRISNEKEDLSGDHEATEPADQKNHKEFYGRDSEGASESENDDSEIEGDSTESSSSPLESDSDATVPPKANNNNADRVDSNDTARSSASESDDDDDDNDDDDDDDDDDDTTDDNEEEEEVKEGTRSEDELTHYTSSLNASVSSIPTLYDEREASVQSPTTSAEETPRASTGQGNEQLVQEPEAAAEEITKEEVEKVEDEIPLEKEQVPTEKEQEARDNTPPGSRQVSGRSATPKTVVLSEFDDVESTIFDRREQSGQGSSSRNKLTSSMNSDKSEVSIKNWTGFVRTDFTSNMEGVTELAAVPDKANGGKRLKTRKMRNANKPNGVETKDLRAKEKKQRPASNFMAKKSVIERQLIKKSSISSDNSAAVTNLQKKIVRRKRRPVKQVSFDKINIDNSTKIITSDSAFFGSRTESRGEEQSSPKPPESDHSGRASSRWSAVETERASTSSTRPASTVQSTRSSLPLSQGSRQTSVVEQVTAANHPPVITRKKAYLLALRYRLRGKWTWSQIW